MDTVTHIFRTAGSSPHLFLSAEAAVRSKWAEPPPPAALPLLPVQGLGWALNRGPLVLPLNRIQFLAVYAFPITPTYSEQPALGGAL